MENKAFSLFELTIAIAALFVFMFFTLPKLSFVSDFVLKNEVEKLFTTFSYLQEKAIASNEEQYLIFDLNISAYSFIANHDVKKISYLPEVVKFGYLDALGPPSSPKAKIKKAVSFKKVENNKFRVTFFPDGNISSGSVYLVDKDRRNLMALSCPVAPFSCVRTYKYQSKKWFPLK